MKKFVSLLLLAGLGITACTPKTSSSSVDSSNVESSVTTSSSSVNVVQDVTSVQITMNQEVLTPGNYPLTAICLPENSIQTVNWGIVGGSVAGIAINNAVLSVGITAEDGLQFQISATSTYDPTKKAFKPFTVSNEVSNVIEIGNETELLAIFNEENYLNQSYALTNHITLTHQWPMIGVAEIEEENLNIIPGQPFNGLFDGRGFTISGIDIRGNALFNAGFFAQIGTQGVVKNTTFEGSVLANGWSGGIAGINQGTISNCVSKVSVSVSGTSAGSIVSVNRGIIDHSIGLAHLSTSLGNDKARSAGLLVANESTLDEVYGDMETLGTPNYTSMIPSTNPLYMLPTSAMKLASTFADFNTDVWYLADGSYPLLKHQGFVPPISEAIVVISTSNIDVYDLEVITDLQIEASIVNGSGTLNYSLASVVVGVSLSPTGLLTFDRETVAINFTVTVVVSIVGSEVTSSKEFSFHYQPAPVDTTVHITNEAELRYNLAGQTNPTYLALDYVLDADIELTSIWAMIGVPPTDEGPAPVAFTGTFDGQGHTISNFYFDGDNPAWDQAFFANIGTTGVIKNLELVANTTWGLYIRGGALLAHTNNGLIENVKVSGKIVIISVWGGGLTLHNYGIVRNSLLIAEVITSEGEYAQILSATNAGTFDKTFALTHAGATALKGGASALDVLLKTELELKTATTYTGWDSDIWYIVNGSYPVLKNENFEPPVVDESVHISNEAELRTALAGQTNPIELAKNYVLDDDIVLSDFWQRIGIPTAEEGPTAIPFTGTFDGQGHTISNFYFNGDSPAHDQSFFGEIGVGAEVRNLSLETHSTWGLYLLSGAIFANHNKGLIENVRIVGKIITATNWGAGLVQHNTGIIRNCLLLVTCLVAEGTQKQIIALDSEGPISDTYALTATGATALYGGASALDVLLKTDTELKTATTYTGWDSSIWTIVDGSYPTLKKV